MGLHLWSCYNDCSTYCGGDTINLEQIIEKLELNEKDKKLFLILAGEFVVNIKENISKSHFELAEETGLEYEVWARFLNTTEINGWIQEQLAIITRAGQRKRLQGIGSGSASSNDVNALKALQLHNAGQQGVDNSNAVILYLPPKERN